MLKDQNLKVSIKRLADLDVENGKSDNPNKLERSQ